MKKAFTLVELLVVIAILAVLMGAMVTSTSRARTRAHIARATQETREITNAILAFEQYAENHTLESHKKDGWTFCTEGNMSMILGHETGASGTTVPVLYNGTVTGGKLLDPWGRPYEYMIQKFEPGANPEQVNFKTSASLPNFFRLTDKERSE